MTSEATASVAQPMDVAGETTGPETGAAALGTGFNLSSTTLLPALEQADTAEVACIDAGSALANEKEGTQAKQASKFDPLAQLLQSDDEDDGSSSDDEKDGIAANGLPTSAAAHENEQTTAPGSSGLGQSKESARSALLRLVASRGKNAATTRELDEGDSDADEVLDSQRPVRPSLRIDSDSDSDSDSDTDAGAGPVRKDRPPSTVVNRLRKNPAKQATIAKADRNESDSSNEYSTDSDAATGAKKKARAKNSASERAPRKPRAASKAAMAKIQQETERLVRETAVIIDPADFTRRLTLSDFFERFDARKRPSDSTLPTRASTTQSLTQQVGQSVAQPKIFHYASDSDEYDVEIVDENEPTATAAAADVVSQPRVRKPSQPAAMGRGNLEAILVYGSQPMHAIDRLANTSTMKRTDGPRALKELNSALLYAVHHTDADNDESSKARKGGPLGERSDAKPGVESQGDVDEGEDAEDSEDGGDESAGASEDESMAGSDSGHAGELGPRHHSSRRTAVISDDEDEDEDEDGGADRKSSAQSKSGTGDSQSAQATTEKIASFMSKFKMPIAKRVSKQTQNYASSPEKTKPPSAAGASDQCENPIPASQDLSYLFSPTGEQGGTQDSLLLTPADASQQPSTAAIDSFMLSQRSLVFDPSQDPLALGTGPEGQETQPTQLTQATMPTMATAEDGSEASALPSMVRHALEPDSQRESGGGDGAVAAALSQQRQQFEGAESNEEDGYAQQMPTSEGVVQQPRRPGRLVRRGEQQPAIQKPKAKTRLKRSEFVDAEAEEGESSDSDMDANAVKHRKFNWGSDNLKPKAAHASDDDEDDDLDMDSDEEEAALLADPMISNDVVDDEEGDEAIRDLHRQQDFDKDEKDIQNLFKDITTGSLLNRVSRGKDGFSLDDAEDFNDRQSRAERMEERLRQRRKLLAREIHDTNLAEIAKNPKTAAFAQAALMRPPNTASNGSAGSNLADSDADELFPGEDVYELEEEIDDSGITAAVQQQLARPRRRVESDVEDMDSDDQAGGGNYVSAGTSRLVSRANSAQPGAGAPFSSQDDGAEADLFSSMSVEKLIVRRKTLLANGAASSAANTGRSLPPLAPRHTASLAKRPGSSLFPAAGTKRSNISKK
ncbi:hypothetical protein GQ54DRAFT_296788 [Martensiomyces pterosporus]|nr:hypothetical protein GQ54DRAFT_296788 [Martensiomyces pterosporus]